MAYVFRCLPRGVATRITLLATSSPSARCFYTSDADDEWTILVVGAFKVGRIFHASESVRHFERVTYGLVSDMFYQCESCGPCVHELR